MVAKGGEPNATKKQWCPGQNCQAWPGLLTKIQGLE